MKRRQWVELTDLNGWPEVFRTLLTEFLDLVGNMARPFQSHSDLIAEAMNAAKCDKVTDFGSGVGGPWPYLLPQVEALSGKRISVELTDRFPAPRRFIKTHDRISYRSTSVDILLPTGDLPGLWSLFNCFHHFTPDDARTILQRAVIEHHPIVIFEMLRRSSFDALLALRIPILVLLLTPFIRPFKLKTLLFTYIIPIAPLAIGWDGLISIFRCYTPEEMVSLTDSLGGTPYEWKSEAYRKGVVSITYLVGYPRASVNTS